MLAGTFFSTMVALLVPFEGFERQNALVEQSMRGVHVVDSNVIWASGAKGTILRSVDGGENWDHLHVDGADEFDFRDVHGFDAEKACLMVAGTPARLYHTQDGGSTWQVAFEDKRDGAFFDAMDFWDDENGIAFGDAIDGRLVIITTTNGGRSWQMLDADRQPAVHPDVHGYAASGSCLTVSGDGTVLIGLGGRDPERGEHAQVLRSTDRGQTWTMHDGAIQGGPTSGIFSLVMIDAKNGVAVGGDYQQEASAVETLAITNDGGETWTTPDGRGLGGYRSAVRAFQRDGKPVVVATGPTGSDISYDLGQSWQPLQGEGFHAIEFNRDGNLGWAVGSEGRMGRWQND